MEYVTNPSIARPKQHGCSTGNPADMIVSHNPERSLVSVLDMSVPQYQNWRDNRLLNAHNDSRVEPVSISNPYTLSDSERKSIFKSVAVRNFSVYQYDTIKHPDEQPLLTFCRQLGMQRSVSNPESGPNDVTVITCKSDQSANSRSDYSPEKGRASRYIPYTNQPLKWHTDGYYNETDNQIRSFVIHCQSASMSGGDNCLLDHEIAYIQLHEKGPELASALCQPDAMTIPENTENQIQIRKAYCGPVFSTDPETGCLYTRYTQRTRNIIWKSDPVTREALDRLNDILDEDNPWITKIRLEPGQGIICNNVLHNRSAFTNGDSLEQTRALLRIRFHDRISEGAN